VHAAGIRGAGSRLGRHRGGAATLDNVRNHAHPRRGHPDARPRLPLSGLFGGLYLSRGRGGLAVGAPYPRGRARLSLGPARSRRCL
jgi:hypothetical protein